MSPPTLHYSRHYPWYVVMSIVSIPKRRRYICPSLNTNISWMVSCLCVRLDSKSKLHPSIIDFIRSKGLFRGTFKHADQMDILKLQKCDTDDEEEEAYDVVEPRSSNMAQVLHAHSTRGIVANDDMADAAKSRGDFNMTSEDDNMSWSSTTAPPPLESQPLHSSLSSPMLHQSRRDSSASPIVCIDMTGSNASIGTQLPPSHSNGSVSPTTETTQSTTNEMPFVDELRQHQEGQLHLLHPDTDEYRALWWSQYSKRKQALIASVKSERDRVRKRMHQLQELSAPLIKRFNAFRSEYAQLYEDERLYSNMIDAGFIASISRASTHVSPIPTNRSSPQKTAVPSQPPPTPYGSAASKSTLRFNAPRVNESGQQEARHILHGGATPTLSIHTTLPLNSTPSNQHSNPYKPTRWTIYK